MSLSEPFTDERPGQASRVRRPRRSGARQARTARKETRTRILDAAVEVLRKKGYAHFRTADVAKAAGVSRGAQLHHFETKEKLVYATMEHVFHNVLATSRCRARTVWSGRGSAGEGHRRRARLLLLDAVLHLARHRDLDQQRPFRKQLMAMVRNARLPAEQAWLRRWWRAACRSRWPTTCCG